MSSASESTGGLTNCWSLEREDDLLELTLDVPGEAVNVLRHDVMDELEER